MATSTTTTLTKLLKTLRENSNVKEKRDALTYISSQAKKLEASGSIKEDRYKELCKLVVESFTKDEGIVQYEALAALNAIVQEFKAHSLHLFEAMLQTDMKTRLKILKLLEIVEDNAISTAANDAQTLNFFKDCLDGVQPSLMEWITPTACIDNLQMLTKVEQKILSDEQKVEEDTINYALTLLRRLYKIAAITFDQNVERFDTLLMDKIVTLAYMGHKRQRIFALNVLEQAVAANSSLRIREDYPNTWAQYKANLQSMYCKRMLLLVGACEPDWGIQWNITIQFLGTDLHRGASLINNLLSVEEKAFKSTDAIIRRQAFLSWKLLIDNFALDHQELATARRIKLLCIPLNAKNSKTELIALTKLEVWWHLIIKLYKDIDKFVTPVITQFLNFCFGPLGDTPLLSSKFDVVASPGKRFFKTKVVAVDALYQLVVPKEEDPTFCAPMLEERLPHSITHAVFQECSKSIIHSIGEAILVFGQLTDQEMKNRHQLGKILWTSLIMYIRNIKLETKDHLYRDVILVVTELGNHTDKPMVKDMIYSVILPDLNRIIKDTEFIDNSLSELVLKILSFSMLCNVSRGFNYYTIKCLLQRCVSPKMKYSSGVLGFLETIMENLRLVGDINKNMLIYIELWSIIAEVLTEYIVNSKNINEGNESQHNFKTVKSVLSFPFQYTSLENFHSQMQEQAIIWKTLYKQFELRSSSISTVKPNEILLDTANMMQFHLSINKSCSSIIINCLDSLLSTINYEYLLAQDEIPSVIELIINLISVSLNDLQHHNCEIALKTLSAMLITVYGHNSRKVVSYLHSCKSVIELLLESQMDILFKEIGNTWEIIVSIFKGLNKQLYHKLLSLYQKAIVIAMDHPNPDIRSSTKSIFEIKSGMDDATKAIVDEIKKMVRSSHSKSDNITKKKEEVAKTKEVHIAGSFLNRKSINTKPSNNPQEKNDKKILMLPEADSQEYVYIKTDLKFDVNRLTEHQKETLKKKREDIPALYNDLSQSSSQNSQNLQEWFNTKSKHINESDQIYNTMQQAVNDTANKENKIVVAELGKVIDNGNNSDGNMGENVNIKRNKDVINEAGKEGSDLQNENVDKSKQNKSTSCTKSTEQNIASEMDNDINVTNSVVSIAKKLDFESREEFPDNKTYERESSPSMLDNNKRRHRTNTTKLNSSLRSDEDVENQKEINISNITQRTLRTKIVQTKSTTSDKQKTHDDIDIKENSDENKKSIKRKYMSDTESDGAIQQRRKRKLISSAKGSNDDDSDKSRDSDSASLDTADVESMSQRMKNEISRLKIDMVFDCPVMNRRRVKHSDEMDKETLKKICTSDTKGFKSKSTETKSAEISKKSSKTIEKYTKDANDINQGTLKRRSKRGTKQESDKKDLDFAPEAEKSNDTTDKVSQSKNLADTHIIPSTSQATQDVTINKIEDEKLDEDNSKSNSNKNTESSIITKQIEQNQNEVEDVVESSQTTTVSLKLDKKYGEKQCFIKINKITNVHAIKASDIIVEKNNVPESISMDCDANDVPDSCEQSDKTNLNSNVEVDDEGNKDSINKELVQDTDNSNVKIVVSEDQKAVDSSPSIKSTGATSFSSPKSGNKVFSRLKSFAAHGRAAHMLGLVTKQSRIENENSNVVLEDDLSTKKLRTKDVENETPSSKKASTIKEVDKIGGPSGSRQEKIFSNMRSGDYSASTSTYTFTTLKNDGEKLSSKLDKYMSDYSSMDSSIDKENEGNISPSREKDDLPILEWSSANPPSLTASPSASILKRHRSIVPEPDPESPTPNKRKRVSFADPPVSKEMGYEISSAESPHKGNKYSTARSPTLKKDSPFKYKHIKLKSTDTEKSMTENDAQNEVTETILHTEKENESLISETCANIMDIDQQRSNDTPENDGTIAENSKSTDILIKEDDISMNSSNLCTLKDEQLVVKILETSESINYVGMEDPETQQDIFDGMDTKDNSAQIQTSNNEVDMCIQDNSVDSIKVNITNDSVIQALPTKENNLEDTMDAQNITELNSTVNLDEVFCEKSLRSNIKENVTEQDTLSATDSIFASLPLTQDSRNDNQNNAEIDPEFLDSTQSIYPTLSKCREPIDTIIDQLINPLWKQNLSMYFTDRNLCTIGDIAQLSEREIQRIPLKGKPKIEFVKKILQRFESKLSSTSDKRDTSACIPQVKTSDNLEQSPVTVIDSEQQDVSSVLVSVETTSVRAENESLTSSTPLTRSTEKVLNKQLMEKSLTEHLDTIQHTSNDVMNTSLELRSISSSTLDASTMNVQTNVKAPIIVQGSPGTSKDDGELVSMITTTFTDAMNETTPLPNSSANTSQISPGSSDICDEPLITHSSVGINTDGTHASSVNKSSRSVEAQMALEELVDEIDVGLVLESAIKRSTPEAILSQYKIKMGHLSETELVKETIRLLGLQNKRELNDALLRAVCRAYGINKVLLRLPDIFSYDKQFFDKVLNVYNKKLKIVDCLNAFDFAQLKHAVCQKCTSSEIVEILSEKLKQDEQEGIKQPMPEVSSLNAMLQRLPMDVIISHTVANEEIIPASVVLDIALQNNSSGDIAHALQAQSPVRARRVLDKLWTSQFTVTQIEKEDISKESLLNIFQSVCSKLSPQDLLNAYHEAMMKKLDIAKKDKA